MIGIADEETSLSRNKGRFFKLFFPLQYRKMWNVRNKTLADLISDYVNNPDLQNVLAISVGLLWFAAVKAVRVLLCQCHRWLSAKMDRIISDSAPRI